MASVELRGISKAFARDVVALRDVAMHAGDGEYVTVVGPSGSGKSTLLRIIAGLEHADTGDIYIGEQLANRLRPKQRGVAMVFQSHSLYPHLSVRRNLGWGLKLRRCSTTQIHQQVTAIAEMLQIGALLERKPRMLSGGERQRVAIGKALVLQPRCLLLDEPLSNLDPLTRDQVRSELKHMQRASSTTILHVTHDADEAMLLGDRIAVLHSGQLQQFGPSEEIYQMPANRFVAQFVGFPRINLLRVQLQDDSVRLADADATLPLDRVTADRLRSYGRSECVLGLRPEAISVRPPASAAAARMNVEIESIIALGDRLFAQLQLSRAARATMRWDGAVPPASGRNVQISVDLASAHWFSPDDDGASLAQLASPCG